MSKLSKEDLLEFVAKVVQDTLNEYVLNTQKLYKPKKSHIHKYRKSKFHPDEIEKQTRIKAIHQASKDTGMNEPSYAIAPNVKVFLNTTLEAIPKSDVSTKILHGIPISKPEAIALARTMMALPGFPFQQPRKLMNLLVLLSIENSKFV